MRLMYALLVAITVLCGSANAQHMLLASTPPQGQIVFEGATQFDPRFTSVRNSIRSCWVPSGVLVQLGANEPCLDYYPFSGAPRGLIVEGQAQNVVLWNRDLTNAVWVASGTTAALNATGIDGVSNSASTLTVGSVGATILQSTTKGSAGTLTSFFARRVSGTGGLQVTQNAGTTWTSVTPTTSWARYNTGQQTLSNPTVGFRFGSADDIFEIDAVQTENNGVSSPILTSSSAYTRAADQINGVGLSKFGFNPLMGTILMQHEYVFLNNSLVQRQIQIHDGTGNNRIALSKGGGASTMNWFVVAGGATQTAFTNVAVTTNQVYKSGISYQPNGIISSINGSTPQVDTSATIPSGLTTLTLGNDGFATSSAGNIWVKRLDIWPMPVTSDTLQRVTQ